MGEPSLIVLGSAYRVPSPLNEGRSADAAKVCVSRRKVLLRCPVCLGAASEQPI